MPLTITQVDAFTDKPFAGNPAAVCLLPAPREASWMQQVAQEMNLSNTAFLVRRDDGFDLRWFTPAVEVDLCGHATLASAHTLWELGELGPGKQARFYTRSGLLLAARSDNWIELDFPAQPVEVTNTPADLVGALGITPTFVRRNHTSYLVEMETEAQVRSITPDFALLKTLPARGVIVTARADGNEFDIVSRYFAPAAGIPEDPVTGSAHCALGPYWQAKLGVSELRAYQASTRGGVLRVRVGDERVYIGGQAVTTLRGELLV